MQIRSFGRMFSVAAALIFAANFAMPGTAHARSAPDSFADLAARLSPAVVNVATSQTVQGPEANEMPQFPPGSPFEDLFKDFFDQ